MVKLMWRIIFSGWAEVPPIFRRAVGAKRQLVKMPTGSPHDFCEPFVFGDAEIG